MNFDLSDSELIEQDAPTPGGVIRDCEDFEEPEENDEPDEDPDGDIDEELAVETDLALGDDEIDEDDDDEDESEEEDSEDDEDAQARKLFSEEIRDLEAAVAKKGNEIASLGNPLIRVRWRMQLCIFTPSFIPKPL